MDEVLKQADILESESPSGMLCTVTLLVNDKEQRKVGVNAHSWGKYNSNKWIDGKKEWRKAVEADSDVMRLLEKNVKEQ